MKCGDEKMKDTHKYYKQYGYTKTDDKKIVSRVKKLLKKHKKQTLIKDGLWELKLLSNGDVLVVYNKNKYYVVIK